MNYKACWMGIMGVAVGLAVLPVHAQAWHRQPPPSQPGAERIAGQAPGRGAESPPRELLRQDFQPQAPMSREEKQQLRRDIGEVGREIYRRPLPHGQR